MRRDTYFALLTALVLIVLALQPIVAVIIGIVGGLAINRLVPPTNYRLNHHIRLGPMASEIRWMMEQERKNPNEERRRAIAIMIAGGHNSHSQR